MSAGDRRSGRRGASGTWPTRRIGSGAGAAHRERGGRGVRDDVADPAERGPADRWGAAGAQHRRATDTPAIVDREGLAKVADIVIEGLKTVTF